MSDESDADFSLKAQDPTQSAAASRKRKASASTPRTSSGDATAQILSYRHENKRKNNPEVGMVNPATDPAQPKTAWAYDPHLDPALQFDTGRARIERLIDDALAGGDQESMRAALEELKRLQGPYLNWTGKAERTSFEVDTVSLHVHERIDPMSILSAVRKQVGRVSPSGRNPTRTADVGLRDKAANPTYVQADLFAAPFENLPLRDAIDFYKHERGWANRLIAGDSLLVMNSLLQKEGMAGQVQMIYIDPPYGIKYGSNFQPFVNKRDVKDRKDEDLTQEPEMIKAFRDTWELGIHSYLTYLRDRLLLAKELLHESGSVFVQINDENVHHVRAVMDEVFGLPNALVTIVVKKKSSTAVTEAVNDYVVWYAKDRTKVKLRRLTEPKNIQDEKNRFTGVLFPGGRTKPLNECSEEELTSAELRFLNDDYPMVSQDESETRSGTFEAWGGVFRPGANRHWTLDPEVDMQRLVRCNRLRPAKNTVRGIVYLDDHGRAPLANIWNFHGERELIYVVQTNQKVIERCLLMTTDPGDLVLDPTCGSGTTAFVAEKWGRRWITCDTSRVALTLAKQRLLTAGYDYYALRYPHEGLKGGFIYKTVPHVTLKSIANNPEIDEIYERMHPAIEQALGKLNGALSVGAIHESPLLQEWQVPFDFPADWPDAARKPFDAFHAARQAMQKQMDASIAAHADQETLYDQPQPDKKKLRITGPFTVEAVPFPTVLALEEAEQPQEADIAIARSGESARQHGWRDELLKTGIRGKGGQILKFAELETLPGTRHLHATGTLAESGERVVVSFGPEHAALEQRQVALALNEAEKLRPAPKFIVFCAFTFDPEAAKDIDETNWPGVTLLKAQMNTDLLTDDLKKARSSNQSFWLMGQPDVEVRKRKDGKYEIEVHGFDYFDTAKGELVSGGKGKIAVWLLDTDYDERSLFPRQVFFPMAGNQDGWMKLKKDIRAELNEDLLGKFHGTVSLPFEAGDNRRIAVKIVDDRGIESLKIITLD
jgi:adenine-specific DNA-methyltransferase